MIFLYLYYAFSEITKPSHPATNMQQRDAHEESQWRSKASRRMANGVPPSGKQRKTKRKDSQRLLVQSVGGVKSASYERCAA